MNTSLQRFSGFLIIEQQNHGRIAIGRGLWRNKTQCQLKAGSARSSCSWPCPAEPSTPTRMKYLQPLCANCSSTCKPLWKKNIYILIKNFISNYNFPCCSLCLMPLLSQWSPGRIWFHCLPIQVGKTSVRSPICFSS